MKRNELIISPEYITAKLQVELYDRAEQFMKETGKNRAQLAEHLGVSRGYVTQLLNGDYDHKLSKFVALALAFGFIPTIEFTPIDHWINNDMVEIDRKTETRYPHLAISTKEGRVVEFTQTSFEGAEKTISGSASNNPNRVA